jgi:hypothetical protein
VGAGPRVAQPTTGALPYHKLKTGGGRRFRREDLDRLLRPGPPPAGCNLLLGAYPGA